MVAVGRCFFLLAMGPAALFGNKRVLNDGGPASPPPAAAAAEGPARGLVPLIQDLRLRILRLHGEFMSPDGARVDYDSLVGSDAFTAYLHTAQQLQWVRPQEVAALGEGERRAAWLNLYNALVLHALAVGPRPASSLARTRFYSLTAYRVAGQTLSLDDLEHGLLRHNRASPNPLRWGFWSPQHFVGLKDVDDDPRAAWAVPLDSRIHFALNCGARSCPAIRYYEAEGLDGALDGAAAAFFQGTEVEAAARRITLSQILKWYRRDFVPAAAATPATTGPAQEAAMLQTILPWLPPDVSGQVAGWLRDGGGGVTVEYAPYDWGLNTK